MTTKTFLAVAFILSLVGNAAGAEESQKATEGPKGGAQKDRRFMIGSSLVSAEDLSDAPLHLFVLVEDHQLLTTDHAPVRIHIDNRSQSTTRILDSFDNEETMGVWFSARLVSRQGTLTSTGGGKVQMRGGEKYQDLKPGQDRWFYIDLAKLVPDLQQGTYHLTMEYHNQYGKDCFKGVLTSWEIPIEIVDSKPGPLEQGVNASEDIDRLILTCYVGSPWVVKERSIDRLAEYGLQAVPTLVECLSHKLPGRIAEREEPGPAVLRSNASSIGIQGCAEMALLRIGAPAVPALTESLSKQPDTVDSAARILGKIGDQRAVAPLIAVLEEANASASSEDGVVLALKKLNARVCVPQLIEGLTRLVEAPRFAEGTIDLYADTLATFAGQSFGFTLIPDEYTGGRSGRDLVPAHYVFRGTVEEKRKAIQEWRDWWKQQGEK